MRTTILYEDQQIIVVYKPSGLAVQTARTGQADVVSELKNYIHDPYLGIVHRLDQPVEGLLVFGRTKAAVACLSRQLSDGSLNKKYYAVICGDLEKPEGELVNYLIKTPDNRAEIVDPIYNIENISEKAQKGSKAVLRYRVLKSCALSEEFQGEIHLADIRIDTGRFHQIRAQMSHAGMPLLGDVKYGTPFSVQLSKALSVQNVALCAYELGFTHPVTGKEMHFQTEPQGDIFQKFCSDLPK